MNSLAYGPAMPALAAAALGRRATGPGRGARVRLQLAPAADRLWAGTGALQADEARAEVFSGLRTGNQPSVAGLADAELVRRCQAGEEPPFTEIVERYKDRVYRLVRRMVGSPDDEDLTQEVFLRAFQAMPGLRDGATLRTWLFRIAHNLCVTELKRRARRGTHVPLEDEGEEQVHRLLHENTARDAGAGFEAELDRREFAEQVRRLVGRLPAQHRAALTLFYVEQARYEEIAEVMGIPLGTVKTYIHRARLRLRDLMLAEVDPAYLSGNEPGGDVREP